MTNTYEIIIRGNTDEARLFLRGFLAGRGEKAGFIFTKDNGFTLSHIRDIVKYHGDVVHLVCNAALRKSITAAVKSAPADLDLEIVESRPIVRASFEFKFSTANRKVAGSIKRLLGRIPDGAQLTGYAPEEIVDPDAEGQELYSPTHEYEFRGQGTVEGDPFAVKSVFDKLKDNEFFKCEGIELQHTS